MNDVPFLAPGCFGSALIFRDDMVCNSCQFMQQCKPVHEQTLAALRQELGIKPPVERVKSVQDPEVVKAGERYPERLTLPVKVQKLLHKLDNTNFNIVGSMQMGQNPFVGDKSLGFMAIAAHLIMKLERPVSQRLIANAMMRRNDWTQGTADAHARMAIQALEHVGAIKNTEGVFTVKEKMT